MKQKYLLIIAGVIILGIVLGFIQYQKNNQAMAPQVPKMKDSHTLTAADNGKKIFIEPGDSLIMNFGEAATGANWTVTFSDPSLFLAVPSSAPVPANVQGIYKALKLGKVTIIATGDGQTVTIPISVVTDDKNPPME